MHKNVIQCDSCQKEVLISEKDYDQGLYIPVGWADAGDLGHICEQCKEELNKLFETLRQKQDKSK